MSQPFSNKSYAMALYRLDNPCATLQKIGDKFGVSREAVRQVLNRLEVPTKHQVQRYICLNCGQVISKPLVNGVPPKFCNRACYVEWEGKNHIPLHCANCGVLFYRRYSEVMGRARNPRYKTDNTFCSKQCQGSYAGKKYGFTKHPENRRSGL